MLGSLRSGIQDGNKYGELLVWWFVYVLANFI
jgi:hypothetical protein